MSTRVIITCTDCGHSTPATTPALAAYGIRAHSCATVRERAARAQRRLDRLALSGPEQPCTHGAHHTHGTHACYVLDRCRCRPCRDANAIYQRSRAKSLAYGRAAYVDAGPARAHVAALTAAGMGLKRIVAVSDISHGLLWKLMYGKRRPDGTRTTSQRIRYATEQTILAITPDLAGGARVDSTGTTRRIQALVAIGWSQAKIAARLGILRSNFTALAQGGTAVTVAHAKAVADLYDQLWDQPPPQAGQRDKIAYSRAIGYAAKAGWAVPMAWDDIDDPNEQPDVGEPKFMAALARLATIDAYSVSYEPTADEKDIVAFQVQQIEPDTTRTRGMRPKAYAYWLWSLRHQHHRTAHSDLRKPPPPHNSCDCTDHAGFHIDCILDDLPCLCHPAIKEGAA